MQPKIRIDYDYSGNWSQYLIPIVEDTMSEMYSTYLPSIITKQHPTYAPIKSSGPRVQPVVTNVSYPNLPRMVIPTVPQLQPTMTPVGYPHAPTISYPRPYINIDTSYSAPW
jgi:hypothetical protein